MHDEPVYDLLNNIKAAAAAWRHRATVEIHPGIQSAFLTCATEIERALRQYYRATTEPDDAA